LVAALLPSVDESVGDESVGDASVPPSAPVPPFEQLAVQRTANARLDRCLIMARCNPGTYELSTRTPCFGVDHAHIYKAMKLERDALREIIEGRRADATEVTAMARELLALREEEDRDGTVRVHVEHVGSDKRSSGWFEPHATRLPTSKLHEGARVMMGGRMYTVVDVAGSNVHVR
jgi:hypothetical protein